jgi:hypothetical protein
MQRRAAPAAEIVPAQLPGRLRHRLSILPDGMEKA